MKVSLRLPCALLLALSRAWGAEAGPDPAHAWFKPALVENRSPLCSVVLKEANRLFYSPRPQLDDQPLALDAMQRIDPEQTPAVTTHGKKMYVAMRTNPGCGGACETRQMFASLAPFETPMSWDDPPGLSKPTPRAPELTLLKTQDDLYHVAVVVDQQLRLYTLTESAAWDAVCKVDLEPKVYPASDREFQTALQSIRDLQSTIDPIRQDAGPDCGTLKAHERGGEFMRDAFQRILYRPWSLRAEPVNSDGSPRVLENSLTAWSTIGLDEYAAVAKFRAQLPVTVDQLSRFYVRGFGWPQADASQAAASAVAGALDRGLAFSSSPLINDGSLPVRRAILENRPVAELDALNWQPAAPKWQTWASQESVLSIAIKHPAALRWLLSKQLDPNHVNAFGKTPLMYAAQHDALDAVRILLEHGANPNAATIFPEDTCTYTLRRANVTALHYAVRYGSADIVQALIDGGALPFVKTVEKDEQPGQTPREWLGLYASPNLTEADQPRLTQLLSAPDSTRLLEYSQQQTLDSEKQYAAGDLSGARRSLKNALQADPSNERALSDLSLVALRAGEYGESLEAATHLIKASHDARIIANAWFNVGLACERSERSYLSYNGQTYCMTSGIFPFLESWRTANSRARAEKLEQLFAATGSARCVVPQPGSTGHRYIFVRAADAGDGSGPEIQRVYVLHPTGTTIPAAQIGWNVTPYAGQVRVPRAVTPRLVGSHNLGRSTLTVFESEDGVQPPVMIGGYKCF